MGFDVALCALESDEVRSVAEEAQRLGRRVHAEAVDVAEAPQVEAFVRAAQEALGPVVVLVNNAGTIALPDGIRSTTPEQWDRTLAVNARGAFLFCRQIVPGMLDRDRGRVINVASVAGLRGLRERLSYSASKHAVVGLTRALAEEIRGSRVTANAVCPGAVVTQLTAGSRPNQDRAGWLQPADVASTVGYLAGPDGAHVHGAIIPLEDRSGGFTP